MTVVPTGVLEHLVVGLEEIRDLSAIVVKNDSGSDMGSWSTLSSPSKKPEILVQL